MNSSNLHTEITFSQQARIAPDKGNYAHLDAGLSHMVATAGHRASRENQRTNKVFESH
jgi:hypothetical protein